MPRPDLRARLPLRGAVYCGDGPAVVHLLRGVGAYDDLLQLGGDGLIAAVMQRVDGASELARRLVVALRQRGWDGDDELADQLDALLGSGPAPMLRALPVDLEELAGILEGDPLSAGGRIDIPTGEVWPQAAIEYVLETGEEDADGAIVRRKRAWLLLRGRLRQPRSSTSSSPTAAPCLGTGWATAGCPALLRLVRLGSQLGVGAHFGCAPDR